MANIDFLQCQCERCDLVNSETSPGAEGVLVQAASHVAPRQYDTIVKSLTGELAPPWGTHHFLDKLSERACFSSRCSPGREDRPEINPGQFPTLQHNLNGAIREIDLQDAQRVLRVLREYASNGRRRNAKVSGSSSESCFFYSRGAYADQ